MTLPLRWRMLLGAMAASSYLGMFLSGVEIGDKGAEAGISPLVGILSAIVLHAVRRVLDEALRER